MKLFHIATALILSSSAISSAPAHSQTISVSPQTLIMNFGGAENPLARIAQPVISQVLSTTASVPANAPPAPTSASAPATPVAASTNPVPVSVPVDVPSFIGGQKLNADAQRVTKCLIENRGDKYLCGMQELNGEISKCVGGVGTPGGCFSASARSKDTVRVSDHPRPSPRYYTSYLSLF